MVRLVFPHALIVTDAFHLHRQVLDALAKVRRSATFRIARGRSGRARLPKMARHALARGRDELNADTSHRGERQRAAVVEVCGLDPPLAVAYELKEAFCAAMAIGKSGDVESFATCLAIFDTWCRASKLEPFKTLANSLRSWREEIVNYARTGGVSNGIAECLTTTSSRTKSARPTATPLGRVSRGSSCGASVRWSTPRPVRSWP